MDKPDVITPDLARMRRLPFLADFCAPLPDMSDPRDQDTVAALRRVVERVGRQPEARRFRVHLKGDVPQTFDLECGPAGSQCGEASDQRPDVEVLTDPATLSSLLDGSISPMAAFGLGRLRLRGNVAVAHHLVVGIRGDEGRHDEATEVRGDA